MVTTLEIGAPKPHVALQKTKNLPHACFHQECWLRLQRKLADAVEAAAWKPQQVLSVPATLPQMEQFQQTGLLQ